MMIRSRWLNPAWIDSLILIAATLYILAGVPSAPFHGDEAMQIRMSRDYFTAFVERRPRSLWTEPPYTVDSPAWLRLINGSVNLYTIGLSLHSAGYRAGDLPSLWQWPLSVEANIEQGSYPGEPLLIPSRIPSALFLALSVVAVFLLGKAIAGRPLAYLACLVYILNPIVLLNGRRAMMEGSMLVFGLLAVWAAARIRTPDVKPRDWFWLGLFSGLALISKHSAILFVVSAFAWVTLNMPLRRYWRHWVGAALLAGAVFIAGSPALWSDPVARFGDLVRERQALLDSQTRAQPGGAMPISQRLEWLLTQPFIRPVEFYEAAFWGNSPIVLAQIQNYEPSPWKGIPAGTAFGAALTLLVGGGIIVTLRKRHFGLLIWLGVTALSLMANPLPWQRYYLPLIPVFALLAALGALHVVTWITQRARSSV
jgi:4-amino-4-deoxy-L-arabinose transferase-like glycosyltransferase